MAEGKEFGSAITVRLGIVAAGVLGGFTGYWLRNLIASPVEGILTWPVVAGAGSGFVVGWAVLAWLARWHRRAGIIAGGVLMIAAVLVLLARFAWQSGGYSISGK
jgi:hypothetical protein